jgi:hypothetical protein
MGRSKEYLIRTIHMLYFCPLSTAPLKKGNSQLAGSGSSYPVYLNNKSTLKFLVEKPFSNTHAFLGSLPIWAVSDHLHLNISLLLAIGKAKASSALLLQQKKFNHMETYRQCSVRFGWGEGMLGHGEENSQLLVIRLRGLQTGQLGLCKWSVCVLQQTCEPLWVVCVEQIVWGLADSTVSGIGRPHNLPAASAALRHSQQAERQLSSSQASHLFSSYPQE